jgi:hypothetical protein
MPIPSLLKCGLLPPGVHEATLEEIEDAFGKNSDRRVELFEKLRQFVAEVLSLMVPVTIYVDGSFVSDKPFPGDVDAVLEYDSDGLVKLMCHASRRTIIDLASAKTRYEIHLLVQHVSDPKMSLFFQKLRPEDAIVRKLDHHAMKGILRVVP